MLIPLLVFAAGVAALLSGAWLLVRGGARLAALLGVPTVLIGLTVVAWGTSAPELVVSLAAALRGNAEIMLGNVIGSNQANAALILGLAAVLMRPGVDERILRFDLPVLLLATLAFVLMALDRSLARWEGLLLLAGFAGVTAQTVHAARRGELAVSVEEAERGPGRGLSLGMVVAGGALLALGGHWIVGAAERIARGMGVPEMVIGITLVAVGTSLPEMAATLVAAWQRESGIAVGNVVGSNLFNLLGVGGLVPLVRPVHAPGGGMGRELWSLAAITVLMALLVNRRQDIPRWGGVILLAAYGILLTWQMQLWP